MDEARAARILAIGKRAEEIKTASGEFLSVCKGIRPPLLPNAPTVTNRNTDYGLAPGVFEAATRKDAEQLQLRARSPSGVRPVKSR